MCSVIVWVFSKYSEKEDKDDGFVLFIGLTFYSVQLIWRFSKRLPGLFLPVLNSALVFRLAFFYFLYSKIDFSDLLNGNKHILPSPESKPPLNTHCEMAQLMNWFIFSNQIMDWVALNLLVSCIYSCCQQKQATLEILHTDGQAPTYNICFTNFTAKPVLSQLRFFMFHLICIQYFKTICSQQSAPLKDQLNAASTTCLD